MQLQIHIIMYIFSSLHYKGTFCKKSNKRYREKYSSIAKNRFSSFKVRNSAALFESLGETMIIGTKF